MVRKLIISCYIAALVMLAVVGSVGYRIDRQLALQNEAIDHSLTRYQKIESLHSTLNRWSSVRDATDETEASVFRTHSSRLSAWQSFLELEVAYTSAVVGSEEVSRLRKQLRTAFETSELGKNHGLEAAFVTLADLVRAEVRFKETTAAGYRRHSRRGVQTLAGIVIVTLLFLLSAIIVAHREARRRAVARRELQESNDALHLQIEQQRRSAVDLEMMTDLGEQLQVCTTLAESRAVVGAYLPTLFRETKGSVYVSAAPDRAPELLQDWGSIEELPHEIDTADCWSLRSGRAHSYGPGRPSVPCAHAGDQARSSICVPMHAEGRALGILSVAGLDEAAPDEQLAKSVAEQLSLGLSNILLRESLRMRALRDPLTDLFNRRYLEESLSREVQRTARHQSTFSVAMIDVDHFKSLNDTYGHAAGDAVLQCLAKLMQSHFRDEDIVCRFGGEEFTVVMTGTTPQVAHARVDQLREKVRNLTFRVEGSIVGPVTISAGLAACPADAGTAEGLIAIADRLLYRAKNDGRDRVYMAEPAEVPLRPTLRAVSEPVGA